MIYRPKGRAGEYAKYALNIYNGCDHSCTYCYAPAVLRMSSNDFARPKAKKDLLKKVEQSARQTKTTEPILLCFTCDPYQLLDETTGYTREVIKILKRHGLSFQVLTKGGSRALRDIDLYTDGDLFGTTLTLINDHYTKQIEPRTALPQDRIDTIKTFHKKGIFTWISLEPVLNPISTLRLIEKTHSFVDLYKVGTLNYQESNTDWKKFHKDVTSLLSSLGASYYVKKDLLDKI